MPVWVLVFVARTVHVAVGQFLSRCRPEGGNLYAKVQRLASHWMVEVEHNVGRLHLGHKGHQRIPGFCDEFEGHAWLEFCVGRKGRHWNLLKCIRVPLAVPILRYNHDVLCIAHSHAVQCLLQARNDLALPLQEL